MVKPLYTQGTRIVGLHGPAVNATTDCPDADLILELRKDCPEPGLWTVVDYDWYRDDSNEEQHFIFGSEAPAFRLFFGHEQEVWFRRANKAKTKEAREEYLAKAEEARKMAAEWDSKAKKALAEMEKQK